MKQKKEKLKYKWIIVLILIVIISAIVIIKFKTIINEEEIKTLRELSLKQQLGVGFGTLVAIGLILILIKFKRNPKVVYVTTWLYNFWAIFVIPMCVGIIVLLGAIQAKYPVASPSLENNLTTGSTFQIAGNSVNMAFNKVTLTFYNLGNHNPNTALLVLLLFAIISFWLVFKYTKDDLVEKKTAQELIDDSPQ